MACVSVFMGAAACALALASVPTSAPALPGKGGEIDPVVVTRTLTRHTPEFKRCLGRRFKSDDELVGTIVILFTIGEAGVVTSAHVEEDTVGHGVEACFVRVIEGVRFPPPTSGTPTIERRFVFDT